MARAQAPQLRIVDFVGDIRSIGASGGRDALAVGITGFTPPLEQMGVRYHAKEGKGRWPTRAIPWLGFAVDTHNEAARMEKRKIEKGPCICEALLECRPGSTAPAPELLASAPFLNLLHCVAPGGFSHIRSGWDSANESGAMDQWRSGTKGPPTQAAATVELRNDMARRYRTLTSRPVRKLHFCELWDFARHPRLPSLRGLALSMGDSFVATI